LVRGRGRDAKADPAAQVEGLLTAEAFELELAKERARIDRGGSSFCLLTISVDIPAETPEYYQAVWDLSAILAERTRIIDSKGWFRGKVGVILPITKSAHIPNIWRHIDESFKKRSRFVKGGSAPKLSYEVFTYPSDGKQAAIHPTPRGSENL